MKAGSTKALITKDISSQQKYSSSTLFPILCYFCTVQFKAGLQCSSLPTQRKAVPTIYNLPVARDSLLRVLRAGWKWKYHGKQSPSAREAAPMQGTPSWLRLRALWSLLPHSSECGQRNQRLPAGHRAYSHPLQPDFTSHLPLTHSQQ